MGSKCSVRNKPTTEHPTASFSHPLPVIEGFLRTSLSPAAAQLPAVEPIRDLVLTAPGAHAGRFGAPGIILPEPWWPPVSGGELIRAALS